MGLEDWPALAPSQFRGASLRAVRGTWGAVESCLARPRCGVAAPFNRSTMSGRSACRWRISALADVSYLRILARLAPGSSRSSGPYRRTARVHTHNCRVPEASGSSAGRFLVAAEGHLDDFPWLDGSRGAQCNGRAVPGDGAPARQRRQVRCDTCKSARSMALVFTIRARAKCGVPGPRPHLRDYDPKVCTETVKPICWCSNIWFPSSFRRCPYPPVRAFGATSGTAVVGLRTNPEQRDIELLRSFQASDFADFTDGQIWKPSRECGRPATHKKSAT